MGFQDPSLLEPDFCSFWKLLKRFWRMFYVMDLPNVAGTMSLFDISLGAFDFSLKVFRNLCNTGVHTEKAYTHSGTSCGRPPRAWDKQHIRTKA